MITVDASAILAIILEEPEGETCRSLLERAGGGRMSPVNYWEVLARAWTWRGDIGREAAETVMASLGIEVVEVGRADSRRAADAFEQFGKRSAAGLNLGDCFAYALAAREGDGLLYKGDDFGRTDVASALA